MAIFQKVFSVCNIMVDETTSKQAADTDIPAASLPLDTGSQRNAPPHPAGGSPRRTNELRLSRSTGPVDTAMHSCSSSSPPPHPRAFLPPHPKSTYTHSPSYSSPCEIRSPPRLRARRICRRRRWAPCLGSARFRSSARCWGRRCTFCFALYCLAG